VSDNAGATAICDFCRHGKVITRNDKISFHQKTNRGYVFCEVTIPTGTCDGCGARSWDEGAEAIIAEAVRRASEKLP
jgi:hypothetical protein